jgi:hypothetical protein
LFLSLITYSQLLRVEFIAHGKSPFVSNWAGGIASVLSLVLCVILQVAELSHPASPKPHLKLVLDAVDAKKVNVVLTNDFLFGLSFSNFMDAGKVLLIPIELGTSNVTLEFSVINDSDAIASDAEVVFAGPTGLNCLKNAFWEPDSISDEDGPGKGWCATCPRTLYRGDRVPLGPLEFPSSLRAQVGLGQQYPVIMFIRANKERKPVISLSFTLVFVASTNASHAGIYRAINPEPVNGGAGMAFLTNKTFLWASKVIMITNYEEIKGVVSKSIANLKETENTTNLFEAKLPGISFNMLIRLRKPIEGRDNYVFDFGENWGKNRISLYIDSEQSLCFRVIDQDSQPIVIKVKPALETFNFDSLCYLLCEYGSTNNFSFVRMDINGRRAVEKHQATPIIVSAPISAMLFVMGSDLSKRDGGVFDVEEFFCYATTFDRTAEIGALNYLNERAKISHKYLSYAGSNWLERPLINAPPDRVGDLQNSDTNNTAPRLKIE